MFPHDVCATEPGFLQALLTGCWDRQRGHGEGPQPLASGPGLSDHQQSGGSRGNTDHPLLTGDAAGHTFQQGLGTVGEGRGLLETGKAERPRSRG